MVMFYLSLFQEKKETDDLDSCLIQTALLALKKKRVSQSLTCNRLNGKTKASQLMIQASIMLLMTV